MAPRTSRASRLSSSSCAAYFFFIFFSFDFLPRGSAIGAGPFFFDAVVDEFSRDKLGVSGGRSPPAAWARFIRRRSAFEIGRFPVRELVLDSGWDGGGMVSSSAERVRDFERKDNLMLRGAGERAEDDDDEGSGVLSEEIESCGFLADATLCEADRVSTSGEQEVLSFSGKGSTVWESESALESSDEAGASADDREDSREISPGEGG